jgi:hypothetical protein
VYNCFMVSSMVIDHGIKWRRYPVWMIWLVLTYANMGKRMYTPSRLQLWRMIHKGILPCLKKGADKDICQTDKRIHVWVSVFFGERINACEMKNKRMFWAKELTPVKWKIKECSWRTN